MKVVSSFSFSAKWGRIFLAFAIAATLVFTFYRVAQAGNPPARDLNVTLESTDALYMDSKDWCNSKGPDAGWYHVRLTNPRNQSYTGLQVALSARPPVLIQDQVRYIGNLSPSQAQDIFFFVDYRALRGSAYCVNSTPPLSYSSLFTATIVSLDGGMNGTRVYTHTLQAQSMLSAGQGGQMTQFITPADISVGQVFTTAVTYGYGQNKSGTSLLAQPAGNGDFNSQCFRLVRTRVTRSMVGGINAGDSNRLWFSSVSTDPADVLEMAYAFQALCASQSTTAKPWSEITTGNDPRYNEGGFATTPSVPLPSSPEVETIVEVTKTITPTVLVDGGQARVTVQFKNLGTQTVYVDQVAEQMSPGMRFAGTTTASQINPANSTISPTLGSSGMLQWYGYPQITYPIPPSGTLASGRPGVLTMVYTTVLTSTAGLYTSTLSARIGSEVVSTPDTAVQVKNNPTGVHVAEFEARPQGEGAYLQWETSSELDVIGFYVYRRSLPSGEWQLLNQDMIYAQAPGAISYAHYEWTDSPLPLGQPFEYLLETVLTNGDREPTGPSGPVTRLIQVMLPLVRK